MKTQTSPRRTIAPSACNAFTLIELLTVIAIIGILAAIIIPTVGKIRQTARAAQCASNMRQIAMALNLYADEHNDLFPKAYKNTGDLTWMQKIASYVGLNKEALGEHRAAGILICPSFKPVAARAVSYLLNGTMNPDVEVGCQWNYRRSFVVSPSTTILLVEGNVNSECHGPYGPTNPIERRHSEAANYAFVDSHIERIKEIITYNDPRWGKE
ncbi:DUF1559 domain-containing protein [Geminisphaera colitermitum]|uniref:DUF1559 family PulG-like putative transporter n=1 Tax=Geminisphaera colitermitum TaxID=1148786 RepID=UPI000158D39F|nr:DUF1559 domain-containing protein [Geminisphaera colitermitum]